MLSLYRWWLLMRKWILLKLIIIVALSNLCFLIIAYRCSSFTNRIEFKEYSLGLLHLGLNALTAFRAEGPSQCR